MRPTRPTEPTYPSVFEVLIVILVSGTVCGVVYLLLIAAAHLVGIALSPLAAVILLATIILLAVLGALAS